MARIVVLQNTLEDEEEQVLLSEIKVIG